MTFSTIWELTESNEAAIIAAAYLLFGLCDFDFHRISITNLPSHRCWNVNTKSVHSTRSDPAVLHDCFSIRNG